MLIQYDFFTIVLDTIRNYTEEGNHKLVALQILQALLKMPECEGANNGDLNSGIRYQKYFLAKGGVEILETLQESAEEVSSLALEIINDHFADEYEEVTVVEANEKGDKNMFVV